MKKYIASVLVMALIAIIAFSFRNTENKLGPHIISAMDNVPSSTYIVYVYFNDKGPNVQSRLSNPLSLVTQRSLDRRLKVKNANELVETTDVPLFDPYVQAVASKVVEVRQQLKWFNALTVEATKEQIQQISELSFVSSVDLVERYYRRQEDVESNVHNDLNKQQPVKDNPEADSLNYGVNGTAQITQIKVNLVHNQGIYGQGVLIASFDNGWRYQQHEAFTTLPMKVVSQYDFQLHIPGANHTLHTGAAQNYPHGTTTLSTIGGYIPGKLIGPAFGSSFLVARTEVDSFERPVEMDNWTAASQWADSLGADVITSSLGYLAFDPGYGGYTWQDMNGKTMPVTRSAAIAAHNGITVFNSAGNNGPGANNTLNGPADADSILTLGAVDGSGAVTNFSSVGPTTDVPARFKPDVMAMGQGVYCADGRTGNASYVNGASGTSYSCPLGAGVGALILSANKNLTPLQVRGILRKFASMTNTPGNTYGWGIINAALSVDSARKLDNVPPTILHTAPFSYTTNTGPLTFKARIFDNGIIRMWNNQAPLIYFRKSSDNGTTWGPYSSATPVSMQAPDTFSFIITGSQPITRVEYYFAAQDIALPTPLMSTYPLNGSGINPPGTVAPPVRFAYIVGVVGVEPISSEIPGAFNLYNNYPNPFNPVTKIKFDIAKQTNAKITVYDLTGREVTVIVNQQMNPGKYEISFDASNYSSGVYFYKMETGYYTNVRKMLLIK